MPNKKSIYLPFFMWCFPLMFFAYQFILRLWPGLMMEQIMDQFSIDATHFGLLAAFYYYGYAGMQIPVAIMLDRFGARCIIFIFALLCSFATALFTYTDNFYLAIFSRFLIGAGSAVGFLGISKVVSEWFPKEQYAKMIGLSFTIGLMGAIYGGKPVSLLIEQENWKSVAFTLSAISFAIGCASYIALRSPKNSKIHKEEAFKIMDLQSALSSRVIWMLAISNLLMVGSLEGFADVWGVQYLMIAYHITKSEAAAITSFIFFGMLFGGPILAVCSKKFGNYSVICGCGIGMAIAFYWLLLNSTYNSYILYSLFFGVGVMCCYQVIVFAAGAKLVAPQRLGITIAFLNCINMLGGSFFHTIIGKFMDMTWRGAINSQGSRIYDLSAYKYALSIIPTCALIGSIVACFIGIRINSTIKNRRAVNMGQQSI